MDSHADLYEKTLKDLTVIFYRNLLFLRILLNSVCGMLIMFYYDVGKRQTGRKCVKFTDYAEREVI